jgi:hypothetical protein
MFPNGKVVSIYLRFGDDSETIERLAMLEKRTMLGSRSELLRRILKLGLDAFTQCESNKDEPPA